MNMPSGSRIVVTALIVLAAIYAYNAWIAEDGKSIADLGKK